MESPPPTACTKATSPREPKGPLETMETPQLLRRLARMALKITIVRLAHLFLVQVWVIYGGLIWFEYVQIHLNP